MGSLVEYTMWPLYVLTLVMGQVWYLRIARCSEYQSFITIFTSFLKEMILTRHINKIAINKTENYQVYLIQTVKLYIYVSKEVLLIHEIETAFETCNNRITKSEISSFPNDFNLHSCGTFFQVFPTFNGSTTYIKQIKDVWQLASLMLIYVQSIRNEHTLTILKLK